MGSSSSSGVECLSRPHSSVCRQAEFRGVKNAHSKNDQQGQLPPTDVYFGNQKDLGYSNDHDENKNRYDDNQDKDASNQNEKAVST